MALHLPVIPASAADRALVIAAEVVQAGGLVVYPTDTLYGLGANPWNIDAVRRIQEAKSRDGGKPLLVITHAVEAALALAGYLTPEARTMMERFWPGPLTLVMPAGPAAPPSVVAADGSIGVRVPDHHVSRRLAELAGVPLISTSANISGAQVASTVQEIEAALGPGVDLYLDGGPLTGATPSTIIDVTSGSPRLVREGALTVDEMKKRHPALAL
jgi:L-threonylcarbamoyladenylate synthase